ncbi:2-methoxy-6-polyprenyl-1,4-benzoquinol methylase, mitochondrial [subsurface metagenome]
MRGNSIRKENIRQFYNNLAPRRQRFKKINWYYHRDLEKYYRFLIPEGQSVLEIGCGTGDLLASLNPSRGAGIDISDKMIDIARQKYPHLQFLVMDAEDITLDDKFDYIIISGTIGDLEDIQKSLSQLRKVVHRRTRIIIDYYNYFWQPVLRLGEWLKLKIPQLYQNWLPSQEIVNLLFLSDFETIKGHNRMLFPIYIPLVSSFINGFLAKLPLLKHFSIDRFIIARPLYKEGIREEYSCSVIVPARNEKGTVEQIVLRTPEMGNKMEIIFVEGYSKDGTREEIERVIKKYPEKNLKLIKQDKGVGKADAVHLGFEAASGDVLMILDADFSVSPEDLPKFYSNLVSGQGEFITGTRLVYAIEKQAMRFLNLAANYLFGRMFTWLLEHHVTDTLCGTKVLWRQDYLKIKENRDYFGDFDPFGDFELLFGAAKLNLRHIEIPVRYHARVYGQTNISRWRHGVLLLQMCWIAFRKLKTV